MKRPRPRRSCRRYLWPHMHALMDCRPLCVRRQLARHDDAALVLISEREPLPRDLPGFGPDWPAIRARALARLAELNPEHPWVREEKDAT